jgi:hypothetical protein
MTCTICAASTITCGPKLYIISIWKKVSMILSTCE